MLGSDNADELLNGQLKLFSRSDDFLLFISPNNLLLALCISSSFSSKELIVRPEFRSDLALINAAVSIPEGDEQLGGLCLTSCEMFLRVCLVLISKMWDIGYRYRF